MKYFKVYKNGFNISNLKDIVDEKCSDNCNLKCHIPLDFNFKNSIERTFNFIKECSYEKYIELYNKSLNLENKMQLELKSLEKGEKEKKSTIKHFEYIINLCSE